MTSTVNKGKLAEDFAVSYLVTRNYRIITRNFHSRFGEVDIFCFDNNKREYVCIEVKSLNSESRLSIEQAISVIKLQRINLTLQYLLLKLKLLDAKYRIDFIGIVWDWQDNSIRKLKHLENIPVSV
jgi:putative endonuclease